MNKKELAEPPCFPELGKRLTTKEVAERLGLNVKTITKHYSEVGGVRLGRNLMFFENRILNNFKK